MPSTERSVDRLLRDIVPRCRFARRAGVSARAQRTLAWDETQKSEASWSARSQASCKQKPPLAQHVRERKFSDVSGASGKLPRMDDDTRRRLLRVVIGEDQPGRGRVRRWTCSKPRSAPVLS
jgi:hypothetical protein